jgi:hypothetical protein
MFSAEELINLESEVRRQLGELSDDELSGKRRFRSGIRSPKLPPSEEPQLPNPTAALLEFRRGSSKLALQWAREFVREFLTEIRSAICADHSGKRRGRSNALTARSAATGLASWLGASFAISNPVALALATFVLLLISSAAISAFCSLTEDELRKHLLTAYD